MKPKSFDNKRITPNEISGQIDKMLTFTPETLDGNWELSNEKIDKLVTVRPWGAPYNSEQILKHAIAHVLRYRRRIESFC